MNNEESQSLRAQLERLPEQLKEYYGTYFSELRSQLERPDLFSEAVPMFLRDYKRVVAVGGNNGVVVAHFPVELEITISETGSGKVLLRFHSQPDAGKDLYEFITFPGSPVSDLVKLISGGEDVGIEVSPGVPWGVKGFAAPQKKIDATSSELTWQAPWTRLICADFNSLSYWGDTEQARREAGEDVDPYVRGRAYRDLDEIKAPEDVEEARVKAGDRGVVIEVFERPSPALLVEYADFEGRTKALVTYSADLENILDVLVDRDRPTIEDHIADRAEAIQARTLDIRADSSVTEGLVTAA